jgi:trimeric autotransporter adhesin
MTFRNAKCALLMTLLGIALGLSGCTGVTSSGSENSKQIAPSITSQPASQTVKVGQTAMFTVVATGTAPLSFQWQKNGTIISGATASSYTTAPTTTADNGAKFNVVISNPVASMASAPTILTVTAASVTLESIAVSPSNPSINQSQTQQFTAKGTYSDGSTMDITSSVTWSSSNTAVAAIGVNTGFATGIAPGTSQITATLGSVVSTIDTLTVIKSISLQFIAVSPSNSSINQSQTQQFTATGTYSDGTTKNITTSVSWASSNTAVAAIGINTGFASGITAGSSQITATLGSVVSPPDALTVIKPISLQSIAVSPSSPSISQSQTQQFTATGAYSDGSTKNITSTVTWTSSNTSVATIGVNTGLATGINAGTLQITATLGSVVSTPRTLTVINSVTLQSIAVSPPNSSLSQSQTQQFTATGTYSDGSTKNITTSVTWASSGTAVATIGVNTGLATGIASGTSQITATLGSVVSTARTLTVINSVTLQSIAVSPSNPSISQSQTQQFTATGTYSDGSTKNITSSVTWVSSSTAVAAIGVNTGLATGIASGTSPITATLGNVTSPADTLTVTKSLTLQSIAVSPSNPSMNQSQTMQFTATGTYSDGSTKNITSTVTWTSSNTSVATIGVNSGLATGISAGTSLITATLGSVVSASDTCTVKVVALQSIAVSPSSPSISQSQTQQFTATGTYSDGSSKDITASVSWTSSNTGVATIGVNSGLATGVSAGTSQITATLGNVASLSNTLAVKGVTLQSITVAPTNPSISQSQIQQFTATGTYSDGSSKDITTSATWASSNTSVATIVLNTGLATGVSAGTSQITATLGNVISPNNILTVKTSGGNSYTTNFSLTENPIAEGGKWINGKITGLDWANIRTTPGLAFGTETDTVNYDDSTVILTGNWGANQMAQAKVHTVNQNSGMFEEVELRLRTSISAHSITGYEINFRCTSDGTQYVQIVRWNGPLGDFTFLNGMVGPGLHDGDVVKATVVGSTITAYVNGTEVEQITDSTFTSGSPGMGFYIQGGNPAQESDYGFTSFTASDNL